MTRKLVLASGNKGKLKELSNLLEPLSIQLSTQNDYGVLDVDETGLSFVENAILKARAVSKASNLPALADDSGIEVDALQGQPGIYSARFSGEHGNDANNNQLLIEKLQHIAVEERTARYQCVLVYMRHWQDPTPLICQAAWEGSIGLSPKGENGFGYDPLFIPEGMDCTAAELDPNKKKQLSHRAKALQLFTTQLALQV
mgnify:CR=1 FL=1